MKKQHYEILTTPGTDQFTNSTIDRTEMPTARKYTKEDLLEALANQRKAILEEVRSEVIGDDEKIKSEAHILIARINGRNNLRKEQRQKLSILEGKKWTLYPQNTTHK